MNKAPINWTNLIFLTLTPIGALTLVPFYGLTYGFTLYEWAWFAFYMAATGLSITAGYHRLWAHKTYKAAFPVRLFYAFWGACGCQNSILQWASDHRAHHRFVDHKDKDPYAATGGFWHAHVGWIVRNHPRAYPDLENVKDLTRDPIVRWQHRHYLKLAIVSNGVLPLLLGLVHGRLFGVFILAFLLRVVVNHHFAFLINSLAHYWGRRPYSDANTSRDNTLLALLTYGEGYHNYHHAFQFDYRNGVRWWHFDPTKWLIRSFAWFGVARKLKRATQTQIERARLQMQYKAAMARVERGEESSGLKDCLEKSYRQFTDALHEWARVQKEWRALKRASFTARLEKIELRNRFLELKHRIRMLRRQWRLLLSDLAHA